MGLVVWGLGIGGLSDMNRFSLRFRDLLSETVVVPNESVLWPQSDCFGVLLLQACLRWTGLLPSAKP